MPKKRKRTPLTFLRFAYYETAIYSKVKRLEDELSKKFEEMGVLTYNHQKGLCDKAQEIETLTKSIDELVAKIDECFEQMDIECRKIKYIETI